MIVHQIRHPAFERARAVAADAGAPGGEVFVLRVKARKRHFELHGFAGEAACASFSRRLHLKRGMCKLRQGYCPR